VICDDTQIENVSYETQMLMTLVIVMITIIFKKFQNLILLNLIFV
jgi:hypothetical protein